jgi:hypothetical protein
MLECLLASLEKTLKSMFEELVFESKRATVETLDSKSFSFSLR